MKRFFTSILIGLTPFIGAAGLVALCMGIAYVISYAPDYVFYILIVVLSVVFLYIVGEFIRK